MQEMHSLKTMEPIVMELPLFSQRKWKNWMEYKWHRLVANFVNKSSQTREEVKNIVAITLHHIKVHSWRNDYTFRMNNSNNKVIPLIVIFNGERGNDLYIHCH